MEWLGRLALLIGSIAFLIHQLKEPSFWGITAGVFFCLATILMLVARTKKGIDDYFKSG